MENAEQILVIILASALALFLVLAIVAAAKVIQILNHLKAITEKAEQIADKAEAVSEFFSKAAGPSAVVKLFANVVESLKQKKSRKKGDEDEE